MLEKGLVVRDASERPHVYRAAVAKEDTERRFMRELSDRFLQRQCGSACAARA